MGFPFLALTAFLCKSPHLFHFLKFHRQIHKIQEWKGWTNQPEDKTLEIRYGSQKESGKVLVRGKLGQGSPFGESYVSKSLPLGNIKDKPLKKLCRNAGITFLGNYIPECDICEHFAKNEFTKIFVSKKLHERMSEYFCIKNLTLTNVQRNIRIENCTNI